MGGAEKDSPSGAGLDPEHIALVALVARGLTDDAIARAVGASKTTIQRRLRAAASALGANSRVTLVVRALEAGVIDLPTRADAQRDAQEDDANASRGRAGKTFHSGER